MSDKIADVVTGLAVKEGKAGRRTYSAAAKRAVVELCNRPGVSVARTALSHGINANLLRRWIVQYAVPKAQARRVVSLDATAATVLPVNTPSRNTTRTVIGSDSWIEFTLCRRGHPSAWGGA